MVQQTDGFIKQIRQNDIKYTAVKPCRWKNKVLAKRTGFDDGGEK